jgi:CxxC motif-containing protein
MMLKTITCIRCPKGCQVTLDTENPEGTVKGFGCPNGREYAINELICPKRTISTTVELIGGMHPRIPVKTNGDIPKEKIFDVMKEIDKISVKSPVKCGEVLLPNVLGTGIDIVACRNM